MGSKTLDIASYDRNMAAGGEEGTVLKWHSVDEPGFRLSGFAFRKPGGKFRRLPEFETGYLPEAVDRLAWHTTGGALAFVTDSSAISIKVKLQYTSRTFHLSMLNCGGFDLYTGTAEKKRFVISGRFQPECTEYNIPLLSDITREKREFLINFPLYGGIEELEIGLDADAVIEAPSPWKDPRPVIFYGTSITQGACAGRPGLSPVNILSRRWNVPVLNFGFAGSGYGEENVLRTIAEAAGTPRMFVLDYAANAVKNGIIFQNLERSVDIIREKHPAVPVVLTSIPAISKQEIIPQQKSSAAEYNQKVNIFIQETAEKYRRNGDPNVYFINSRLDEKYDDWDECQTDGLHLNDLGFYRTARLWAEQLAEIIS